MNKNNFTHCLHTAKQVFWNAPFLSIYAVFKIAVSVRFRFAAVIETLVKTRVFFVISDKG